jgi:hypothetical protein
MGDGDVSTDRVEVVRQIKNRLNLLALELLNLQTRSPEEHTPARHLYAAAGDVFEAVIHLDTLTETW